MKALRQLSVFLIFVIPATIAVAQESSSADETTPVSGAEETIETPSEEAAETGQDLSEDRATAIMNEPLDGTTVESFSAGLEKLDEEATEEDYRKVMSALSFLLFYDIAANRDKAKLYSRLNGKTPNEILERVENHRKGDTRKR